MSLKFCVLGARSLLAKDKTTSDPYVLVATLNAKGKVINEKKTAPIKKTLEPRYQDGEFEFDYSDDVKRVRVQIRDKDLMKSQFLGELMLTRKTIEGEGGNGVATWYPLAARADKPDKIAKGDIEVSWTLIKPIDDAHEETEEEEDEEEAEEAAASAAASTKPKKSPRKHKAGKKKKAAGKKSGGAAAADEAEEEAEADAATAATAATAAAATPEGTLVVHLLRARNLQGKDDGGKSGDPYVVIGLAGVSGGGNVALKKKSSVVNKTLAPEWGYERFAFPVDKNWASLVVDVRDHDRFRSQRMGETTIDLPALLRDLTSGDGGDDERWFALAPHGEICFRFEFAQETTAEEEAAAAAAEEDKEAEDAEEEEEEEEGAAAELTEEEAAARAEAAAKAKCRAEALAKAAVAPDKGRIRLLIDGARGLMAKDGSTSDPFAEVRVLNAAGDVVATRKTAVRSKTLAPEWNESLEFDYDAGKKKRADEWHVEVEVRDKDLMRSQFLGFVRVPLRRVLFAQPRETTAWHALGARPDDKKKDKVGQGDVSLGWTSDVLELLADAEVDDADACPRGLLTVRVIEARGLAGKDDGGTSSDPYVTLELLGGQTSASHKTRQTAVCKGTLAPRWDTKATFTLPLDDAAVTALHVEVRDKDVLRSQFLGCVRLPATRFRSDLPQGPTWFMLAPRPEKVDKMAQGELCLELTYTPPAVALGAVTDDELAAARDATGLDPMRPLQGVLVVSVMEARNLLAKDDGAKSDPFAVVEILDARGKSLYDKETEVVHNTLAPEWKQKFSLKVGPAHQTLRIEVRDKDSLTDELHMGDKVKMLPGVVPGAGKLNRMMTNALSFKSNFLGEVRFPLVPLFNVKPQQEAWFPLQVRPNKPEKPAKGDILLRFNYVCTEDDEEQYLALRAAEAARAAEEAAALAPTPPRILRMRERLRWRRMGKREKLQTVFGANAAAARLFVHVVEARAAVMTGGLVGAASLVVLLTLAVTFVCGSMFSALGWAIMLAGCGSTVAWYLFDHVRIRPTPMENDEAFVSLAVDDALALSSAVEQRVSTVARAIFVDGVSALTLLWLGALVAAAVGSGATQWLPSGVWAAAVLAYMLVIWPVQVTRAVAAANAKDKKV